MNQKTLTSEIAASVAEGIADGLPVQRLAGLANVDRSTMAGWLERPGFLREVAEAMDCPDKIDAGLARVLGASSIDGETDAARKRRAELWGEYRKLHASAFAAAEATERANRTCVMADSFNIRALIELEERAWLKGTAAELARGLRTAAKRRAHRCRRGIVWDWQGLGCYFKHRWTAKRCAAKYADEDGMDEDEQRRRFGKSSAEFEDGDRPKDELRAMNTRPLLLPRDRRLPVTPAEAEAFLLRVMSGDDFIAACAPSRAHRSPHGKKKGLNTNQKTLARAQIAAESSILCALAARCAARQQRKCRHESRACYHTGRGCKASRLLRPHGARACGRRTAPGPVPREKPEIRHTHLDEKS